MASFNGRRLPAAIVNASFTTVDRDAGKYGKGCVTFAVILDDEFEIERKHLWVKCEDRKIKIAAWKKDNEFSP